MAFCSRRICGVLFVVVVAMLASEYEELGLDVLLVVVLSKVVTDWKSNAIQCEYMRKRTADKGKVVQDTCARWGITSAAVAAMRRHPEVWQVQSSCATAMEAIALFNAQQSIAVAQAGGIHAVIDALRRFPMNREVAKLTGCLSSFNDLVPENRVIILKLGGIELIKLAMKNHYNDPDVLFRTGCAISATTGDYGVSAALAADGGIKFLMQMMRDHLKSYRVGQEIMQATRNMMHEDRKHREALLEEGFAKNALDTIKTEMHERGTPTIGSTNLAMLAHKNQTMQDSLAAMGAIETIMEAMVRYSAISTQGYGGVTVSEVWPLLPSTTQAMWCITRDNPNTQSRMVAAGGVPLLTGLIRSYAHDTRVLGYACASLGTAVHANASVLAVIDEAGGVPEWCRAYCEGKESPMNIPHLEGMIGRF